MTQLVEVHPCLKETEHEKSDTRDHVQHGAGGLGETAPPDPTPHKQTLTVHYSAPTIAFPSVRTRPGGGSM